MKYIIYALAIIVGIAYIGISIDNYLNSKTNITVIVYSFIEEPFKIHFENFPFKNKDLVYVAGYNKLFKVYYPLIYKLTKQPPTFTITEIIAEDYVGTD